MNKFTNFNEELISKIINDLAKTTPGIVSGNLKSKKVHDDNQTISIDVGLEFEETIYDIMNLALDFKNLLYSNLSSKIDNEKIEINIYIN